MDNINDDYLTNLSWLKLPNHNEVQSKVECTNNHIDDDLQCLCWLHKIRPTSTSSHLVKRLSFTKNKYRNSNHFENTVDLSSSHRVLMVQTLNNSLFRNKTSQQSFIVIRSSNGNISCLSIRHFV